MPTLRHDGSFAFYGARDSVIHPSDEILFGRFEVGALASYNQVKAALDAEDWEAAFGPDYWIFGVHYDNKSRSVSLPFGQVELRVAFGAENAPQRQYTVVWSRADLFLLGMDAFVHSFQVAQARREAMARALSALAVATADKKFLAPIPGADGTCCAHAGAHVL